MATSGGAEAQSYHDRDNVEANRLSRGYANYTTFMLALVFLLAAADRNMMAILLVPIQDELQVGDAAMGALTGLAFTVVYVLTAFPLARLVDRGNRRNVLAVAIMFWSIMTASCGLAVSYFTLLLARMGVAAGEAVHSPAIYSMVSDLYAKKRRGFAIACLTIGTALGIALGAYVVGSLSDIHGWRTAFLVMGIPGLILACLVRFTLPEPRRSGAASVGTDLAPADSSMLSGLRYLLTIPTAVRLFAATVLLQVGSQSMLVWAPAFFMRVHDLSTSDMSAGFGLSIGVGSVVSLLIAGVVTDRLAARGERNRAYYCAAALVAATPFLVFTLFAPTHQLAFVSLFMFAVISAGVTSVSTTLCLVVVSGDRRGLVSAVLMFFTYVVGGGFGPFIIGAINDQLSHVYGETAIRYALVCIPASLLLSAIAHFFAARNANEDARRVN